MIENYDPKHDQKTSSKIDDPNTWSEHKIKHDHPKHDQKTIVKHTIRKHAQTT